MVKKTKNTEGLTLKWGSLKEWHFTENSKAHKLMKKYVNAGSHSASAIYQTDTPEQKELILKIIDVIDCDKIWLDWDGKQVSKAKAKKYVKEYGN